MNSAQANKGWSGVLVQAGSNTHIVVHATLVADSTQAKAHQGRKRGIEKRHPVAAELNTEPAARQTGSDGHLPRRVVAFARPDTFEFLLVAVEGVVLANGPPGKFADVLNGGHIDAMFLTTLELGKRMFLIAQINHEHGIRHVDVKMFFGQTEIGRSAFHVAHDAVGVSRTLHEQLARAQQEVELATKYLLGSRLLVFSHCIELNVNTTVIPAGAKRPATRGRQHVAAKKRCRTPKRPPQASPDFGSAKLRKTNVIMERTESKFTPMV